MYVSPFAPHKDLFNELAALRKAKNELDISLIQKFDALGFDWKLNPHRARWMYFYEELKNFQKAHGHCNVPHRHQEQPRLGAWVSRQRSAKDKLKPWQLKLLHESGFEFSDDLETHRLHEWEKNLEKLREYHQKQGNSQVPSTYKDKKLARWVINQRSLEDSLSEYQKQKLSEVAFLYKEQMADLRDTQWKRNLEKLKQFKQEHGHVDVPSSHQNRELANWVRSQRFLKTKLSRERRTSLKSLGFKFSEDLKTERQQSWLRLANELKTHLKEQGTISGIGANLRKWWHKQLFKKDLESWQKLIIEEIKSTIPLQK